MSGKQRTLFQTWGSRPQSVRGRHSEPVAGKGGHCFAGPRLSAPPAFQVEQEEDDDDLLLVAVYEAEKTLATTGSQASEKQAEVCSGEGPSQVVAETLPGFDLAAGSVWIYPTNVPIRDYQLNIVHSALLQNTLVCLPTGLGKTFIAAVVMYNFYRWYPSGKIVFMAPTKPLVAQQIEACYNVMGIPQEHMAEMTGTTQAINRKEIWQNRKVFFLTPQVMVNDLTRGACPAYQIKCLVIDEAHKALGNHAYCQVVRELSNYTNQFRILALSATPGSDAKAVQQVISNLLIAQIELRSEDSPDIQPYSHERQLEKFVVPLGDELVAIQKAYIQVLEAVAGRLIRNKLLSSKDIPNLTKYQIVLARDQFRKNPPTNIKGCEQGILEGDYALCISLFHGYELLLQMGSRSFYVFLRTIMDGSKGAARARGELSRNHDFMNLYQQLESMFAGSRVSEANGSLLFNTSLGPGPQPPFIYSHPKLKKLEEVVLKHFKSWKRSEGEGAPEKGPVDTRVMIFSSFRDSVQEIAEMLNQHLPVVKVMTFVGHSSTGNGVRGFTQKEQLEVMKRFRDGGYNTLVSTCVGEEGLDIGEVDLIVCFDAQKSPIRLVQRMGRTGRKRQGRIIVILTAGREERTYNQSQSIKRSIHKAILGNSMLHFNSHSPRMVPDGLHPAVHKMYITQASYETKDNARQSSVHRKSALYNGTMCKQSNHKEDWSLTTEELEAWNTLYRIQESDGIQEVTMPRTCFETFSDVEQKPESDTKDFHEISLSEWRLWQNQPLPTHLVDHSERCNHFIGVMEMIELLRHEEDGCNYELEMMPYLHKDDVFMPKKSRSVPADRKEKQSTAQIFNSKKEKKGNSAKGIHFLSFVESNDECASLFKESNLKSTKKSTSRNPESKMETDHSFGKALTENQGNSGSGDRQTSHGKIDVTPANQDASLEEIDDLTQGADLEVRNELSSVDHPIPTKRNTVFRAEPCEKMASNSDALLTKSTSEGCTRINADSGYNSFTEESAVVSCNMFYPPEEEWDYCTQKNQFNIYSLSTVKSIFTNVESFLSRSPPPFEELTRLEDIMFQIDMAQLGKHLNTLVPYCAVKSPENNPFLSCLNNYNEVIKPEREFTSDACIPVENELSMTFSVKSNLKLAKVDLMGPDVLPQHSESAQIECAAVNKYSNKDWHDIFDNDSDDDNTHEEMRNRSPKGTSNTALVEDKCAKVSEHTTNLADNKHITVCVNDEDNPGFVGEGHAMKIAADEHNTGLTGDEHNTELGAQDSLDLFEEEPFSLIDDGSPCKTDTSRSGPVSGLSEVEKMHTTDISTLLTQCKGDLSESRLRLPARTSMSTELEGPIDKNIFDCSEELFSVNFDLGFSIDESDGENASVNLDVLNQSAIEKEDGISYSPPQDMSMQAENHLVNCSVTPLPSNAKSSLAAEKRSTPVSSSCNIRFAKSNQGSAFSPLNSTREDKYASPVNFDLCESFFTSLGGKRSSTEVRQRSSKCLASDIGAEAPLTPFRNTSRENADAVKKKLLTSEFSSISFPAMASSSEKKKSCTSPSGPNDGHDSESEDEVVFRRKRKKANEHVLNSPQVTPSDSELDSPIQAVKKRRHRLDTSKLCDDLDFENNTKKRITKETLTSGKQPAGVKRQKTSHHLKRKLAAQQFFDVEAELSSEGADEVSSDETFDSADEGHSSLVEFLNDNTELSQALNDSEMHGIYMKSVRSLAFGNRLKLVPSKARNNDLSIFSQIPEQDETYLEDSFCVQEDNEEEAASKMESSDEEDAAIINFDLLNQDSFIGGRKQYCTRRRVKIKQAQAERNCETEIPKKKVSRIIVPDDSSEEETEPKNTNKVAPVVHLKANSKTLGQRQAAFQKPLPVSPTIRFKKPPDPGGNSSSLPQKDRCQAQLQMKASLSEVLDFQPENGATQVSASLRKNHSKAQTPYTEVNPLACGSTRNSSFSCSSSSNRTAPALLSSLVKLTESPSMLCVLADSREISSGSEVISCLKMTFAVKVEVCSLNGCDYIVSNRMAVERKLQSEFVNCNNRNKLIERIQHLQKLFERICLIVEKDRIKPGETSRLFQRTKYYDCILSSLIAAGIRILFSSSQEETAGLLKELALVEQRKKAGILVPTEVTALKKDALQFYLSIPNINHVTALNMCHRFGTVKQMTNSSVTDIASCAQVSQQKAEEIYRYIHYVFDSQMVPTTSVSGKAS